VIDMESYRYRGARALVMLHEHHLRRFVQTWRRAASQGVVLPECDDSDYASLDALLRHVLRAARGYMIWICEQLGLNDPRIEPVPQTELTVDCCDDFVAHLVERWRGPLQDVAEEGFHRPEYPSRWKVMYCIDAMLEHAVMHPIRHAFQLDELLGRR